MTKSAAEMFGIPKERLDEYEDLRRYYMKKSFGTDKSEVEK